MRSLLGLYSANNVTSSVIFVTRAACAWDEIAIDSCGCTVREVSSWGVIGRSTGSRLGRVAVGCLGTVHVEHHFEITCCVVNSTANVFDAFRQGQNNRDGCLQKNALTSQLYAKDMILGVIGYFHLSLRTIILM